MKKLFTILILSVLLSLPLLAHQGKVKNNLEKNNLKSQKLLRTSNGKVDAKSGVIRYIYGTYVDGYQGNAEEIAHQFVSDKAERFGMDVTKEELQTFAVKTSKGGTSVFMDQTYQGIPVYNSRMVITLNKQNAITFAASNYRPIKTLLKTSYTLSGQDAINKVNSYLNVTGKLLGEQKAELMFFETSNEGFKLSWYVTIPTEKPMGDWEVFVDANSGEILHVHDRMMYENGQGYVWDPDPLTTAGVTYGGLYVDNNDIDSDALNDERVSVTLQDITYEGGVYKLEGPYAVLADWESPNETFPELADSSAFTFTRSEQGFEAVMVYYHIDRSTRRLILDLGYDESMQRNFQVDPHGLDGDDNSHYVPSSNYVAFGEGGVDDAEDADVIWHEHAHSFQTNLTGGMSYSGETMSLQEGASDYWAASYSRYINDYNWGYVFTWDGHNTYWDGRRCDLDWVYPDDYVSGHNGGQIWSSALMNIWEQVGRDVTDQLFIETHYLWGYAPGLEDAAEAFIQADENVYSGAHKAIIIDEFDARGLVNKEDYMASITHSPLTDSEQSTSGYEVIATIIQGSSALDTDRMWVVYGNSALTDSLDLVATGNPNEYAATIPDLGNDIDIYYYIAVIDQGENLSVDPSGAPTAYHSFHIGSDSEAPVITHTALSNQAKISWPATVRATVTDNFGVDTVVCFYGINSRALLDSFALITSESDLYENPFPVESSAIAIGDSVHYYIKAVDNSSNSNVTVSPENGFNSFEIIDSRGSVLIVDDDPNGKIEDTSGKAPYERTKDSYGKSADDMQTLLDALGYTTTLVDVTTALMLDFSNYNLLISSSGSNQSPVSNSTYRTKLETWVSTTSNKLLIEGGEVGYDAISAPGYSTFAANVLHASSWVADNVGNIQIVSGQETHTLATTPNAVASPISVSYSGYGDEDAVLPASDATLVYEPTSRSGYAGVLYYDDDDDETNCQIIYFAFNLAALATEPAEDLLENSVQYLLATPAPAGMISGTVDLTDIPDDSGVSVYLSGDLADTTTTNSSGYYAFSSLEAGTYNVNVHMGGYTSEDSLVSGITVNQDTVENVDFSLDPIVSAIGNLKDGLPQTYALEQNYPNPFNPVTAINYQLAHTAQVKLILFNSIGQKVQTLVSKNQVAGYYSVTLNASDLSSGVYFYKIIINGEQNFAKMRKMLLLK